MPSVPGSSTRSLSGHILPTLGRAGLEINGSVLSVYVVEELYNDILLGGDALNILEANIDYGAQVVTLKGKKYGYRNAGYKDDLLAAAHTEAEQWAELFPEVLKS